VSIAVVTFNAVAVVALFARVQDSVATLKGTARTAEVPRRPGEVIAFLSAVERAVAALAPAAGRAAVTVFNVAVVALFISVEHLVTAGTFELTVGGASIAVEAVAVVTLLKAVDDRVSALDLTASVAAIVVIGIPVIAALWDCDYAVAADLGYTARATAVTGDRVAVVAQFAGVENCVAALAEASRSAPVAGHGVSIVAGLARLDVVVAAALNDAPLVAAVTGDDSAVVAALSTLNDAVPAAREPQRQRVGPPLSSDHDIVRSSRIVGPTINDRTGRAEAELSLHVLAVGVEEEENHARLAVLGIAARTTELRGDGQPHPGGDLQPIVVTVEVTKLPGHLQRHSKGRDLQRVGAIEIVVGLALREPPDLGARGVTAGAAVASLAGIEIAVAAAFDAATQVAAIAHGLVSIVALLHAGANAVAAGARGVEQ
jgi:hypothetical protein